MNKDSRSNEVMFTEHFPIVGDLSPPDSVPSWGISPTFFDPMAGVKTFCRSSAVVFLPSLVQCLEPGPSGRSRRDPIPPALPIYYRLIVVPADAGYAMVCHPIQDLLGPRISAGALGGSDVTGVDEDVPRSRVIVDFAEQVLQGVEPAVDVSDEDDSGGVVHGRDGEGGGFDVLAEIRLLFEAGREGGGVGEEDVEEESCEEGEGGHGGEGKADCFEDSISHGRYK